MNKTYDGTPQPRDSNPPSYTVTMGAAAEPANPQQPTTATSPSYAVNIPQPAHQSNFVTSGQPVQYQNQPYPQQPPGPVVVQQANPAPAVPDQYSGRLSIGLGIALKVLAGLGIILNGIAIGVDASLHAVGHGFWVSIFVITSGSLAVEAGQRKTRNLVIANLKMSFISILAVITGLVISLSGMIYDFSQWNCRDVYYCMYTTNTAGVTINALLVAVFLAELNCCLFVAILCFSGGGCCHDYSGDSCCSEQSQQATLLMPHTTSTQPAALVTRADERTFVVPMNYNNNNNNSHSCNNNPITGDPDNSAISPYPRLEKNEGSQP